MERDKKKIVGFEDNAFELNNLIEEKDFIIKALREEVKKFKENQ